MASHKDLKQILGRRGPELLDPEVFEHGQINARELLHELAARPRRVGMGDVGREIERAADERAVASPDGADGKCRRHVRLPHTRRTRR